METENKKKELYLPTNIPESRAYDYFSGYGIKELVITICSMVVAIIFAVILFQYTNQILYSGILGGGILFITILIIKRDKFDESLIDQLKIIIKFMKEQKQYEYFYYNIYEDKDMVE